MTLSEIKILIEKDIDAAFDSLDEIFEDDGAYNDLCKEYFTRPNNFDLTTLRSRLKRFVAFNKDLYIAYCRDKDHSKKATSDAHDSLYKLLCHLDFKDQIDCFDALIKTKKPVIPFVIRAEQNYGQRWLYNRLIAHYEAKNVIHVPLIIDLSDLQFNLEGLIDYLSHKMEVPSYDKTENAEKKKRKLKNLLGDKVKTATQFIVLKNAYSFVHSNDFNLFYNALNYFHDEIEALDSHHKCILLFVESTVEPYKHQHHCIFSGDLGVLQARRSKEFRFIDLDKNTPISLADLKAWLEKVDDMTLECFDCYIEDDKELQKLLTLCDNGNPEKVIPFICETIGKNYEEHEHLWLKH